MSFVKLHAALLNSSLWLDRDARDLFITALLLAKPFELRSPTPEIAIGALHDTGWVVPPGWYGFVPAASVGLIARAGIATEPGLAALERLAKPDMDSRSSTHDGRRLVRVDGGFLVLNYMLYRQRDETANARMRRYRAKKTNDGHSVGVPDSGVTRDVTAVTRNTAPLHVTRRHVTQAEAEAEAELKGAAATATDSVNPNGENPNKHDSEHGSAIGFGNGLHPLEDNPNTEQSSRGGTTTEPIPLPPDGVLGCGTCVASGHWAGWNPRTRKPCACPLGRWRYAEVEAGRIKRGRPNKDDIETLPGMAAIRRFQAAEAAKKGRRGSK